jgi:hypothetical protein
MKNPNFERCALVLKSNPLEPSTIVFRWTPAPWWSCSKSTPLPVTNLKLFVKGCYETENTFIFAWSLVPGVGHYRWLCAPCRNPTLRRVWGWNYTPEMGTSESTATPKTLEFDCRSQNTLHYGILYIIGKLLKFRCQKWARMSHLDICSTSYGKKKGRKSNWQFDSWSLKVGNRPNPEACKWNATHHWKALDESYKFV